MIDVGNKSIANIEDISANFLTRDDGLLLWKAIYNFIVEFLDIFHHSDDEVCRDHEIQSWVTDIHDNGLPTREGK